MGVWGLGPFDNDTAGDMIAKLAEHVRLTAEGDGDSDDYYAARAAAKFVLAAHGTDILGGPSLETVARALARMRGDPKWLSSFKEPKKLAREIEKELNAVVFHMRLCRGCRRSKKEWSELDAVVDEARAIPIPESTFALRRRPNRNAALEKRRKRDRLRRKPGSRLR